MKEADVTEKSDLHQELVFYKGFSPAKSKTDGQTSTGAKSIPTLETSKAKDSGLPNKRPAVLTLERSFEL